MKDPVFICISKKMRQQSYQMNLTFFFHKKINNIYNIVSVKKNASPYIRN